MYTTAAVQTAGRDESKLNGGACRSAPGAPPVNSRGVQRAGFQYPPPARRHWGKVPRYTVLWPYKSDREERARRAVERAMIALGTTREHAFGRKPGAKHPMREDDRLWLRRQIYEWVLEHPDEDGFVPYHKEICRACGVSSSVVSWTLRHGRCG